MLTNSTADKNLTVRTGTLYQFIAIRKAVVFYTGGITLHEISHVGSFLEHYLLQLVVCLCFVFPVWTWCLCYKLYQDFSWNRKIREWMTICCTPQRRNKLRARKQGRSTEVQRQEGVIAGFFLSRSCIACMLASTIWQIFRLLPASDRY